MAELKFECGIWDAIIKRMDETREKMLNEAAEHYDMPKEEIERQVEQIGDEVRKEHSDEFII
jgi:hypothetical protein